MSSNLSYTDASKQSLGLYVILNMSSNISSDLPSVIGLSEGQHLAVGIYIIIVGLLGICGNTLVLMVVWKFKSFRTTTNIFIINLALADLGISVFGFPFSASSSFAGRWISGHVSCQWYAFNGMVFGIGSIGFLVAISIDRYNMTCRYRSFIEMKPIHYILASFVIWLNATVWAAAPLVGWGCYDLDPSGTACGLTWKCDWIIHATYTISVFLLCFCVPCGIIVYCYTKTYQFISFLGGNSRNDSNEWTHQKEITRMCAVAIILFIVAWTPYAIVFLWATLGNPADIPIFVTASPPLFAKSSACYNPFIYALMNRRYRMAIKQLFKCGGKVSEEEQLELNRINGRI